MNEDLPQISLDLNGEEFIATPLNASLHTFLGQTLLDNGDVIENSSRNHLFLRRGEAWENDEGKQVLPGMYIFGEAVQRIGAVMLTLQFPAELHQRDILPSDEDAYQVYINNQDFTVPEFPDDWQ